MNWPDDRLPNGLASIDFDRFTCLGAGGLVVCQIEYSMGKNVTRQNV